MEAVMWGIAFIFSLNTVGLIWAIKEILEVKSWIRDIIEGIIIGAESDFKDEKFENDKTE